MSRIIRASIAAAFLATIGVTVFARPVEYIPPMQTIEAADSPAVGVVQEKEIAQATPDKTPTANAPTSTLAQRLDCRIALRIARAGATAADQANIDKVTASPAGIDLLATALAGEHNAQPQLGASTNGTIQTFIQFLLANMPAIISAIESIIAALSL